MDFDLYRFVNSLLQPTTLLQVLVTGGLAVAWIRGKLPRRWAMVTALPAFGLYLISTPLVAYFLLGSLEWPYPPSDERPKDCQAIVVLNAGINYPDAVRRRAELDTDTMLRCVHAARLYHYGERCRVVVTGGPERRGGPGPSCAAVMRDFLVDLSVRSEDILVEDESRTTYENVILSQTLLEQHGLNRIVVVTDATHMYRSLRCFQNLGLDTQPSACRHEATSLKGRLEELLPNPSAAHASRRVFHEWLGLIWYKLHGRI